MAFVDGEPLPACLAVNGLARRAGSGSQAEAAAVTASRAVGLPEGTPSTVLRRADGAAGCSPVRPVGSLRAASAGPVAQVVARAKGVLRLAGAAVVSRILTEAGTSARTAAVVAGDHAAEPSEALAVDALAQP